MFQVAAALLLFLLLLRLYCVVYIHSISIFSDEQMAWACLTGWPGTFKLCLGLGEGKVRLGYIATTTIESIRSTCKPWRWGIISQRVQHQMLFPMCVNFILNAWIMGIVSGIDMGTAKTYVLKLMLVSGRVFASWSYQCACSILLLILKNLLIFCCYHSTVAPLSATPKIVPSPAIGFTWG